MTSLRKEYDKSKKRNDEVVSEAAINWVAENVIIINEKLDRKSVSRLIDSIQKFEDTFGPYKDRIPSIASHLDAAESGLQLVITGRSSDRKTANMLKQLSYLYSTLSDFFTRDLPVLLRARIFKAAKDEPEMRIDMIPALTKGGLRHNPDVIRDALSNALKPSVDEKKLLGKIYRSTKLPKLETKKIARELIALSFKDLEELTNIGKVPMVATPDEVEEPPQEAAVGGAPVDVPTPAVPKVESIQSGSGVILEKIDAQKANQLAAVIGQISNAIDTGNPSLAPVKASLDKLVGQSRTELAQNKWLGGSAVKQLVNFYNVLENLKGQWDTIKPLFSDGELTPDEKTQLNDLLTAASKDNIFQNIARKFKLSTPHYPGLEPEAVVQALMSGVDQEGGIESVSKLLSATTALPKTDSQGEPQLRAGTEKAAPGQETAEAEETKATDKPPGTEGPSGEGGQRRGPVQSVDRADLDAAAGRFNMTVDQLANVLKWVGVGIEG